MNKVLTLIFVVIIIGLIIFLWPRKLHCSDFTTQQDAQQAYNKGAKGLDRDHDKIACENLPQKQQLLILPR